MAVLLKELESSEIVSASPTLSAQLFLEAASIWLLYGHVARAEEAIKAAEKLLGLKISLVGES